MRFGFFINELRSALVASTMIFSLSCEQKTNGTKVTTGKAAPPGEQPKVLEKKPSLTTCAGLGGNFRSPDTIESFVKLINTLPKPVTVACVLDALEGPFRINATSNRFSGQPAFSNDYPRIFIFLGTKLILSVVPKGDGNEIIELSYRITDASSIKGEIHFPVEVELSDDHAYKSILDGNSSQTVCKICHLPESVAPAGFPSNAFVSRLVAADPYYDVSLSKLKVTESKCDSNQSDECLILKVIFTKKISPISF